MSAWLAGLTGWLTTNPEWLGLAVFLLACAECLALIGLLVPGIVLLFGISVLAGHGVLPLGKTLLLAYSGGLLGDLISYGLGRRFHQNIRRLPVLRHHPEWIGQAEMYFLRYGLISLLIGRFIGPLRPMLPMIAGMLSMPFVRFAAVSLLGAAGWAVAYVVPGWATGAALHLTLPQGFWREAALVAISLVLLIGLCVHSCLGERRRSSAVATGLSLALLLGLFFGWPHLIEFDQGLLSLVQAQRSAGLDAAMQLITRLGDFTTQLAVGLLLSGLLLLTRQWRAALFAASTLLGTALANGALKHLVARLRPEILLEPLNSFSFPSGHSSAAFAFFLVLGVLAGRGQAARLRVSWLVLASLPALAIAGSRVYLGVHWPSDILAGMLLAVAVCACSLLLVQRQQVLPALPRTVWRLMLPAVLLLLAGFVLWPQPLALTMYRYN